MDLQTEYLGIRLKNPLLVSSCSLSKNIKCIKAMEQAGAAGIVMYSIFEEAIKCEDDLRYYYLHYGTEQFVEASTYFPNIGSQESYLVRHLYHLQQAVGAVKIPIIGSLNAVTISGWADYALQMQDTGISALELNLYHPTTNIQSSDEIEKRYLNIVYELKSKLYIPLTVKLSPFFASIDNMVLKLVDIAGADGVVMFNRFCYPDFDIHNLNLQLRTSCEAPLPLTGISRLYNKLPVSIAASTGVDNSSNVIKYILAGAGVVMCASCLMKHGISYLEYLLIGLENWLKNNNYYSIKEIRGLMSKELVINQEELERVQYIRALEEFSKIDTSLN